MAIEAGRAAARLLRSAILGLIVLLLRERRHQKTQAFDLLRRENAVEQLVVVFDRDELALRDVTEVGALIEVHRRWKFWQKMIRDVVLDVEPREIAPFLPLDLVDQEAWKHETALLMLGVRQRVESLGKRILIANLLRAHIRKSLPRLSRRELDANSFLHRLGAVHRDAASRPAAQVISLVDNRHVLSGDLRLLCGQSGEDRRERLGDFDRHVARFPRGPCCAKAEPSATTTAAAATPAKRFAIFIGNTDPSLAMCHVDGVAPEPTAPPRCK